IVGILQGFSDLLDVGDDRWEGEDTPLGMALAQRATWSITHDKERDAMDDVEIEDAQDMGMFQAGDGVSLLLETFHFALVGQARVQDFNGCAGTQPQMFPRVEFCEAAPPQETDEAIVAKLLANTVLQLLPCLRALLRFPRDDLWMFDL